MIQQLIDFFHEFFRIPRYYYGSYVYMKDGKVFFMRAPIQTMNSVCIHHFENMLKELMVKSRIEFEDMVILGVSPISKKEYSCLVGSMEAKLRERKARELRA